jgi:hypothetical protein
MDDDLLEDQSDNSVDEELDEMEGTLDDDELMAEADDEADMEEMLEEISFAEFAATIPQLEADEAEEEAAEQNNVEELEEVNEEESEEELSDEEVLLENPPLTAEEEAQEAETDSWMTHISTLQDGLDSVDADGDTEEEEGEEQEEDEEEEEEVEQEDAEQFEESSFLESAESVHDDVEELPHEDLLLEVSEHAVAAEQAAREVEQNQDNALPTQVEAAEQTVAPVLQQTTVHEAVTFESDVEASTVEAEEVPSEAAPITI